MDEEQGDAIDRWGLLIQRAEAAEARAAELQAEVERIEDACRKLIEYRNRNTLNFQLEKADDYIRLILDAIGKD